MAATTTKPRIRALLLIVALVFVSNISLFYQPVLSWTPPSSSSVTSRNHKLKYHHQHQHQHQHQQQRHQLVHYATASRDESQLDNNDAITTSSSLSRRDLFRNVVPSATAAAMTVLLSSQPYIANAAALPSSVELERLQKGHARIKYMLNNWDDVTSVCKNTSDQATKQVVRTDGGDKCSKTPLNVQVYMGYKSTEDPLYKIDKLMIRAAPLIKDDGDSVNYLEAVENYKENADNVSMMAYTSSWGEANPNGGKDVIDDYLEKTRLDVVSSERSLKMILGYLGLEPLPPSKNP
jgi:hypothetical protein